jgi:hypothetical protein
MSDETGPDAPETLEPPTFSSYELERIDQAQRFLLNVAAPDIAAQAARVGYGAEEHALGWRHWTAAAGIEVPFDYYLSEAERRIAAASSSSLREHVRFLDQAENRWFPRARNAIRRYVAAEQREAVEQAFFEDMPQQPEGPGVVGSMRKFVVRLEGLRASSAPGAREAVASLERKGLNAELVRQIGAAIDAAQRAGSELPAPVVSGAEVAAAAAARRAGYEQLNLWFTDWAEVLRGELGYHQLVRLGLTPRKGGRPSRDPGPGSAEPGPTPGADS